MRDKAFEIVIDPNYGYQRGLASVVYMFFDKKSSGSGVDAEPNYQLANEPHRQIIRKFKRLKICLSFRDNIWGADMQSLSKYNRGIKYLLWAIDLFSKYAWVAPLKDKKGTSIVNAFQKQSQKEQNQIKYGLIRVVNFTTIIFLKRLLKMNNIEMYSPYNEGKSVVAERFMRTLKNKLFKHMRAVSKNVYFDMLDDIVNKYNNTVHKTIKMKPIDVTSDS